MKETLNISVRILCVNKTRKKWKTDSILSNISIFHLNVCDFHITNNQLKQLEEGNVRADIENFSVVVNDTIAILTKLEISYNAIIVEWFQNI